MTYREQTSHDSLVYSHTSNGNPRDPGSPPRTVQALSPERRLGGGAVVCGIVGVRTQPLRARRQRCRVPDRPAPTSGRSPAGPLRRHTSRCRPHRLAVRVPDSPTCSVRVTPDPDAVRLAVRKGSLNEGPIRAANHPIAVPLAVHVGAFRDISIRVAQDPGAMWLAAHTRAFSDARVRLLASVPTRLLSCARHHHQMHTEGGRERSEHQSRDHRPPAYHRPPCPLDAVVRGSARRQPGALRADEAGAESLRVSRGRARGRGPRTAIASLEPLAFVGSDGPTPAIRTKTAARAGPDPG